MRLGLGNNLVKTAFPIGTSPSLDLAFALDRSFTTDPAAAGNALITSRRGPAAKFSRGSGATQVNAAGLIEYAPENLLVRSEEFNDPIWLKSNSVGVSPPVVAPNQVPSPIGNLTADKIDLPAVSAIGSYSIVSQLITQTIGFNFKFSVYLRGQNGGESVWVMWTPNGSTYARTECILTTSWQRFDIGYVSAAGPNYCQIGVDLRDASQAARPAQTIYAWGAQLERASTARTYYPTTTAAFYGPRFDHDPATGASKGLLIEEQRTNLAERSEAFNDAYWSKFQSTIDFDTGVAPDGRISADSLKDSAVTDAHSVFKSFTNVVVNTNYVWSIFVKADTKSWVSIFVSINNVIYRGYFNLTNGVFGQKTAGVNFTSQAFGNGWYRLHAALSSGAFTTVVGALELANGDGLVSYSGDGTGKVFVWGAQFEVGVAATSATFPLSYIPTTSGTVPRSADVCSIIGTDFSSFYNQSEGAMFASFSMVAGFSVTGRSIPVCQASNNTFNELVRIGSSTASLTQALDTTVSGSLSRASASVTLSLTSSNKSAGAYKAGDSGISTNGSTIGLSAPAAITSQANRFDIGSLHPLSNLPPLCGHIARIQYSRKRLSNAKLQSLTYPDDDADAYIAKVELMLGDSIYSALPNATSDAKRIITDFIKAEKDASRWALHKRIYLPIYNNSAANAIDAVSLTSGTFIGGITHAVGYFQGNGTSGYFDTIVNWNTLVALENATIGTINLTGHGTPNMMSIGVGTTVATAIRVGSQNSPIVPQAPWAGAGVVRAPVGTNGIQMASRSGGVTRMIRRSASGITEETNPNALTGSVISSPFAIGANNSGGIWTQFSNAQIGGGVISLGLDSTQLAAYSLALKNLYESLTGLNLPA